jgi:hypothetical protein
MSNVRPQAPGGLFLGNYILESLAAGRSNDGGSFGATKKYKFGAGTLLGKCRGRLSRKRPLRMAADGRFASGHARNAEPQRRMASPSKSVPRQARTGRCSGDGPLASSVARRPGPRGGERAQPADSGQPLVLAQGRDDNGHDQHAAVHELLVEDLHSEDAQCVGDLPEEEDAEERPPHRAAAAVERRAASTTAAMACSSSPLPALASPEPSRPSRMMPAAPTSRPLRQNSAIVTRPTGTPERNDACGFAPIANALRDRRA